MCKKEYDFIERMFTNGQNKEFAFINPSKNTDSLEKQKFQMPQSLKKIILESERTITINFLEKDATINKNFHCLLLMYLNDPCIIIFNET